MEGYIGAGEKVRGLIGELDKVLEGWEKDKRVGRIISDEDINEVKRYWGEIKVLLSRLSRTLDEIDKEEGEIWGLLEYHGEDEIYGWR
ncbi:MAG: hypothetical protein QW052_06140 [Candidatus Nitrosocaldaceae archaeon]